MSKGFCLTALLRCALLLLVVCPSSALSTGYLSASGTRIVDTQGNPVQLRGVNLGNWLYCEPWMFGSWIPAYNGVFGQTDQIQNAVYLAVGATKANQFWSAYRASYVQESDIVAIHDAGFNCVRIPIDYRLFVTSGTGSHPNVNFGLLGRVLYWCHNHGVYAIVDMHCVPGGKNVEDSGQNLWNNTHYQDTLCSVWKAIAQYFANDPTVAAWDLVNEPVVDGSSAIRDVQIKLTNAIRSVDQHHMIFAEGDAWDSWLDPLGAPWDSNMGFSDHNYASWLPNNLPHDEDLATQYNIPLWMGEFGYNSNNWNNWQRTLLDAVNVVNGRSIQASWTLWSWKSCSMWSIVKHNIPASFQALIDYWAGNGPQPSQTDAFAGLMALVDAVKYEHCTTNKDVLDGYVRDSFPSVNVPYASLTIPGRIDAVNYDMGAERNAYHDDVSSNYGGMGGGFQTWNDGWSYRCDGVDIGATPDPYTGFYVGWTDAGEWMYYTVNCTPGAYDLSIRFSGYGGSIHLFLDGVDLVGKVDLPSTSGWMDFQTITLHNVPVTSSGTSTLRVYEDTGGFNLNWFSFTAPAG